jgi:CSLREA domain-containing protein
LHSRNSQPKEGHFLKERVLHMNIKRLIILAASILLGLVMIPLGLLMLIELPTPSGFSSIAKASSSDTINAATTRTIDVDNIDDDNPEGGCTLREAIDVANAGLGAGTAANGCTVNESGTDAPITYEINLPSYTYTLSGAAGNDDNTGGDLDIIANVTINGTGASSTIINGGGIDRVLHLPIPGLGITLAISNVSVQNGRVFGSDDGGGIYNNKGMVTISNSTISNNKSDDYGGGIYNFDKAKVTINNSIIVNNEADRGGGIHSYYSTLTIINSTINNNKTGDDGGGINLSRGMANISNSTIANNTGFGIYGRSIDNISTLNIFNSTISGNSGGGISVWEDSYSNRLNVANSTISGNFTNGNGGGISSRGITNLTNVTITDNYASGNGGGIYREYGEFNIKNSVVAGNSDRYSDRPDCYGTFVSQQFNLIGKNSGCVTSFPVGNPNGNNDFVGTSALPFDPLLAGLTGDPSYYLLQLDSPAIDQIPAANCTFISSGTNPLFTNGDPVTTDQPGNTRDSTCDIGAFEVPPVGIQVLDDDVDIPDDTGSVDFGIAAVGLPISKTFTVRNIGKTNALTLSDLTVSTGFSIASDFGNTTVVTGGQTAFEIQLNAVSAGSFTGTLSFTNNVVDKNPFNFDIDGTVGIPPEVVTISGPSTGFIQEGYTFTATVSPITTTLPLIYIWQASGQLPVTHTSSLTDTVNFTWNLPGSQTVSAEVIGTGYPVSDTHVININAPILEVSPGDLQVTQKVGEVTTRALTITNSGPVPLEFNIGSVPGGAALEFDGIDDQLNMGTSDMLMLSDTDFTVEAWISTTNTTTGWVLGKHDPGWGNGYGLTINHQDCSPNKACFDIAGDHMAAISTSDVNDGQWHHIAGVYDVSGTKSIFIDGILEDSNPAPVNIPPNTAPFRVGYVYESPGIERYQGQIDEVRVWNVARTGAEIQSTMNTPLSGTEPFLIGYWKFDEGSGQTAYDSTLKGNNGQLGSTTGVDDSDPSWFPVSHQGANSLWLTIDPISGTVSAFSSIPIQVTFDASGMQPGEYTTEITFQSNDPVTPSVSLPVTMTVEASPEVFLPLITRDYCSDFFDDFSDPASGWYVGEDDIARSEYLNGEFRVLSKQVGYYNLYWAPTCDRQNYVVEVDARWEGTPGSSYGLLFGLTGDFDQYYLFDVNTDNQEYRLMRFDGVDYQQIVPVASSPAINPGTATNHLKVAWYGDQIYLEVNGTELGTFTDGNITGLTGAGIVASPYDDNPTSDARFDNFSVTNLPGSQAASPDIVGYSTLNNNQAKLPSDQTWWLSSGDP